MKFPIPSDWDGSSWCKWAVCWPASEQWEGLLRGFLSLAQRGRTWDERTGSIHDIQAVGQQITEANLPLVGSLMACNDTELAASFSEIAAALRLLASRPAGSGCCGGSAEAIDSTLQGTVTQPIGGNDIPLYGSQPPMGIPLGDYPPNYNDTAEYLVDKCRIAHMIADGVALTLRGLGAITIFNLTAVAGLIGLAMMPAIAFPPAAIPIMIAAVIALGLEMAVLTSAAAELETRRDDLICYLYTSDTAEFAIARVGDLIDLVILAIDVNTLAGSLAKTIIMMLFSTDTVNQLFSGAAALGHPDADCTSCGCQELTIDLSTREFLSSYTLSELAIYDSVGTTTHVSSEAGLQLTNPTTPNSAGIFRFEVDNPDDLEFGRIVITNQVGACCNVYFFAAIENQLGEAVVPFASDALAGEEYTSAANFETPVIVKGLIIYAGNSINQGFDWTIENILLTCAV